MEELTKIGSNEYEEFKTEFFMTEIVREYLEKNNCSSATLIPEGWLWYEVELFDVLDDEMTGTPNEKYGTKFKVVYTGISELNQKPADDFFKEKEENVIYKNHKRISLPQKNKEFLVNYSVLKN